MIKEYNHAPSYYLYSWIPKILKVHFNSCKLPAFRNNFSLSTISGYFTGLEIIARTIVTGSIPGLTCYRFEIS
jgi:hypothetical protein